MKESLIDSEALSYYLPLQVLASLLLALIPLLIGLFLAWLIWGHNKRRVIKFKRENNIS